MYATTIIETSAMKAWERGMYFIANSPLKLRFGGGREIKHALDSQVQIILDENAINELLNEQWHPSDPFCTKQRVKAYKAEYKKEFDASVFDYTYRNILGHGFVTNGGSDVNQIYFLKKGLQKQIDEQMGSNRNVAVLFNPSTDNFSGLAIPCWNEILVRWEKEGYCSVHTTFRSHDMSAWNANMLAISEFVNGEIVKPCGCKILYWSEHNYSLHIYSYDLSIVAEIVQVSRNPALATLQEKYDKIVSNGLPLRWE